ncbi:MAG: hypothetical protein HQK50_17325 [Oligoflexia bacterium]|nr:hypothetical protein [Oligoflexia bacterium]
MKSFDEIRSVLNETQRYIKLTRALILKRVLMGLPELDKEQRFRMSAQIEEIKRELGLNDHEFNRALSDLENKRVKMQMSTSSTQSSSSSASAAGDTNEKNASDIDVEKSSAEVEHVLKTVHCINKKCKHRFTLMVPEDHNTAKATNSNRCPLCGSGVIFLVNGGHFIKNREKSESPTKSGTSQLTTEEIVE